MDLATLWFALVVLCWVLFAVLEGFDFGVGVLAGVLGRDEHERGAAVRTVAVGSPVARKLSSQGMSSETGCGCPGSCTAKTEKGAWEVVS